jgi:hypothetical protein
VKRRPRWLWLVAAPAGSDAERAAAAAIRASLADGWEASVVLPWRSSANTAGLAAGFGAPGDIVEARPVELALEHFAFRGELRRDAVEPGLERWWACARSARLEPPLAAAFLAAAALDVARAGRHSGIVLVGLPAAFVPILLSCRLSAHPQFEELRTLWVLDDLEQEGWIDSGTLAELGLPRGLVEPPFGEPTKGGRASALRAALYLADGLIAPPARGLRETLRAAAIAVERPAVAEALEARSGDIVPFAWGLEPPAEKPAQAPRAAAGVETPEARRVRKRAALRELGLPDDVRAPLVVAIDPSPPARALIAEAVPSAERQRAHLVFVDSTTRPVEGILGAADLLVAAEPWSAFGFDVARALRCGALPVYYSASGAALASGGVGFPYRALLGASLKRTLGTALSTYRSSGEWQAARAAAREVASADPWPAAFRRWRATWREVLERSPRRIELPSPPPLSPMSSSPAQEPAEPLAHEVYIDWGPGLPERYQEDTLVLLVQSPRSLYAYWDRAPTSPRAGTPGHRLRYFSDANEAFLDVAEWGESWLTVEPGRTYGAELLAADGEVLLRAAPVTTPPEERSAQAQVRWSDRMGGPMSARSDPKSERSAFVGDTAPASGGDAEPSSTAGEAAARVATVESAEMPHAMQTAAVGRDASISRPPAFGLHREVAPSRPDLEASAREFGSASRREPEQPGAAASSPMPGHEASPGALGSTPSPMTSAPHEPGGSSERHGPDPRNGGR